MRSERHENVTTTLLLDTEETHWLHGIVQNPLCDPAHEDPVDALMRKKFFEATSEENSGIRPLPDDGDDLSF